MINGKEALRLTKKAVRNAEIIKETAVMSPKDERILESILQQVKEAAFEGEKGLFYRSDITDGLRNKLKELSFDVYGGNEGSFGVSIEWDISQNRGSVSDIQKTKEEMKALAASQAPLADERKLAEILKDIEKSASNGYFSIEISQNHRKYVYDKLTELGYEVIGMDNHDHPVKVSWD